MRGALPMTRGKILIVENDAKFRFGIRQFLQLQGYEVHEAESCGATLKVFQSFGPDVVVSDYALPDGNALDLLLRLKSVDPDLRFLVIATQATIDLAVQMIKAGADQFLTKPVEMPSFLTVIQQTLEHRRNSRNRLAELPLKPRPLPDPFLGTSRAIRVLAQKAQKLLSTDSPILIQGETGTGKGVLAAWLHSHGPRREESFVDLNCASLSKELLESDLFGHQRGAFTGAVVAKKGLLEVAHGGTVFLDEIGDLDPQVQPKFLKVLEEKRFRKLGDVCERLVDVRLIAATHKDLNLLVQENKFRLDLYFRINTFLLQLPPLRERIEDIPILARQMLKQIAADLRRNELVLSPEAEKILQAHQWPGNIRELRQFLERTLLFCEGDILTCEELCLDPVPEIGWTSGNSILTLSELEHRYIEKVLRIEGARVEAVAKRLGVSRSALYEKIKKHGIDLSGIHKASPEFRTSSPTQLNHQESANSANATTGIS